MDKSNMELSVLIQHYEVHNRTEGKSPRTVQWYDQVLVMLKEWLQSQNMSTNLKAIGEMEVRHFILYVQSRPGLKGEVSTHTVNSSESFSVWKRWPWSWYILFSLW